MTLRDYDARRVSTIERLSTIFVWALIGGLILWSLPALGEGGNTSEGLTAEQHGSTRDAYKASLRGISHRVRGVTDCNENGMPDEDDIDNCNGSPGCDDCNLTGLPDECDIALGTSSDVDTDGVPDECVFFDGGGADDNWSTDENWDGDESPNNQNQAESFSATVGSSGVILDESVNLDTLRLLDGAALQVVGDLDEDLELEESGGLQIGSRAGPLSRLFVGNGRTVSVGLGLVHVKSGGIYEGESAGFAAAGWGEAARGGSPMAGGHLTAGSALIESRCGEPAAEMNLTGTMSADIIGDLVIDASRDCVLCSFCPPASAESWRVAARGGETPPIVRGKHAAYLHIGGDLVIEGAGALHHTSTQPLVIEGSFINHSSCPECIVVTGPVVLGSDTRTAAGVLQSFEVAGLDVGPSLDGFLNSFSVIDVSSGATVTFENAFGNQVPASTEALYVQTLILRNGSAVTIAGCPVYYNTLIDEGAAVSTLGGGSLIHVNAGPSIPAVSTWGLVVIAALLLTVGTIVVID